MDRVKEDQRMLEVIWIQISDSICIYVGKPTYVSRFNWSQENQKEEIKKKEEEYERRVDEIKKKYDKDYEDKEKKYQLMNEEFKWVYRTSFPDNFPEKMVARTQKCVKPGVN